LHVLCSLEKRTPTTKKNL